MPDPASQIKAINLWTSRIVPVILIALTGYVTWITVVTVCGKHDQSMMCFAGKLTGSQLITCYGLAQMLRFRVLARLPQFLSYTFSSTSPWP